MTIRQAAKKAKKAESTLRNAIKRGTLAARKISPKVVLVEDADLQAYLDNPEAHKTGPKPRKIGA